MKYLFMWAIRFYWKIIPPENRNRCIFSESCSNHVFRLIKEKGLIVGFKAFVYRFKNCRNGYNIEINNDNHLRLKLISGDYLEINQINKRVLENIQI